nr:MAG TPA: hypothetical protein [Caudoviricetes sp.]
MEEADKPPLFFILKFDLPVTINTKCRIYKK